MAEELTRVPRVREVESSNPKGWPDLRSLLFFVTFQKVTQRYKLFATASSSTQVAVFMTRR